MVHRQAIVLIFAALVLREGFLLFPEDPTLFDPFPYADIQISIQLYAYFALYYVSMALFAWAFLILMPAYEIIITAWFFLQCIELLDYFVTYNSAWFRLWEQGISITWIKLTIIGGLILYKWIKQ